MWVLKTKQDNLKHACFFIITWFDREFTLLCGCVNIDGIDGVDVGGFVGGWIVCIGNVSNENIGGIDVVGVIVDGIIVGWIDCTVWMGSIGGGNWKSFKQLKTS